MMYIRMDFNVLPTWQYFLLIKARILSNLSPTKMFSQPQMEAHTFCCVNNILIMSPSECGWNIMIILAREYINFTDLSFTIMLHRVCVTLSQFLLYMAAKTQKYKKWKKILESTYQGREIAHQVFKGFKPQAIIISNLTQANLSLSQTQGQS